jgi:hypothetical protein
MDKLNQNAKYKDQTKLFTDCSARPRGSQTIMWFPGSKKHTEVDIHIDTNVSIPVSRVVKLSIGCCAAICILNILFVTAAMRYQNSELSLMEQNVMVLNHKVELMAVTADSLHQSIVILQEKMNTLMSTHCSMAGGVSANYQGSEHSQEMEVASSTDLKILVGSNFSLLELGDNILNMGGGLKDIVELENVDLTNRTIRSSAEGADSPFISANDTSVEMFGSLFTNDIETSGRLQELKLENVTNSSQHHVLDILFQADDSSGYEYGETEGISMGSMGRAKRSNRRGNERLSGGRRHLNNKIKNGGTINLLAFQDA